MALWLKPSFAELKDLKCMLGNLGMSLKYVINFVTSGIAIICSTSMYCTVKSVSMLGLYKG